MRASTLCAVAVVTAIACGGGRPAPEMAPLPDESAAIDAGPSTAENQFEQLVIRLAAAVEEAGSDCAAAEKAFRGFLAEHTAELSRLADDIRGRGTEQALLAKMTGPIQTLQRVALACPGIELSTAFEPAGESTGGDDLAARARAGATAHWRVGDSCHAWKLAGDSSGEMLRVSPGPVLRFGYTVEGSDVIVSGELAARGPLGEVGGEAACGERLALGRSTGDSLEVGAGRWYWSAQACAADDAAAAPDGCISSVSAAVVEAPDDDSLKSAYDGDQAISVVALVDEKPACAVWKFAGRGRNKTLERRLGNSREYFDARYDGKTLRLTDTELPVEQISRLVYRVGDHPWFIGDDCGGVKMAAP